MYMMDGYQTLIGFTAQPNFSFWEKRIKPPGVDGGGAIDETTMLNQFGRTRHPKALFTLTDCTVVAAYEVELYTEVFAHIQTLDLITIFFPGGETLIFWGWLDKFDPAEMVEGEQPNATLTIIPSQMDDNLDEDATPDVFI